MKPAKNTSATSESSAFKFTSNNLYADKDEYLSKNLVFSIREIEFEAGRGFEGSDRWAITVATDGRADEILTFGSNSKRDAEFKSAQNHLQLHGPIPNVRLKRSGKAYYLETVQHS